LKAAVLAVVLEALIKVARRALKRRVDVGLAIAAFVAIALLKLPFPLIVLAAAMFGALWSRFSASSFGPADRLAEVPATVPEWARPSASRLVGSLVVWLAIWFAPLLVLVATFGSRHVFVAEAVFFSKMATVTFGGAYAVLAYVAQQAVETYGWLKPDEMLTGLGLAETTPGPLILVLVYVGFLGGARLSGFDPLFGGLAGAAVTLWFTFVPCFLWIFVGAPYVETIRTIRWLTAALAAVTAAIVGIIANLAVWFGLHVLFGEVREATFGIFVLPLPDISSFDWAACVIALAAGVALLRFKANMIVVLAASAMAGALLAG
jgi:chromate transporter